MKRITNLLLVLALVLSLATTVFAEDQVLQMTKPAIPEEGLIYITLELTQSVEGDSASVSYEYDSKHLKPVVESCSWVRAGVVQDFSRSNKGVWAVSRSVDLKGGLCVLAFELQSGTKFTQTEVSATVNVKNAGEDVGTYTAKTVLKNDCKHTYGEWMDLGEIGHGRICSQCKSQQTDAHQWVSGQTTENPDGTRSQNYTCKVCHATKTINTSEKPDATQPESNDSQVTEPTGPVTLKTTEPTKNPDAQKPTEETEPVAGGQVTQPDHDHDYDQEQSGSVDATVDHSGHDYSQTNQNGGDNTVTGIVIFAALAVMIGGAIWLVKRKKN